MKIMARMRIPPTMAMGMYSLYKGFAENIEGIIAGF